MSGAYTHPAKVEPESDPVLVAAHLAKVQPKSLPKLARLRAVCELEPELPLAQKAEKSGVSYNQAQRWRKKGLLDPDNYRLALSIAQQLGPELQNVIASNAAGLTIEAQRQTLRKLPEASAKEASSIAAQQQQIAHLASGQATSRVEFTTREEAIAKFKELGLIRKDEPITVTAEVIEEDDDESEI